jgi:RNA polymerase primary sigma factor
VAANSDKPKGVDDFTHKCLIDHGRRKGRINRGEVIDLVPDAEFDDDLLQDVVGRVSEAGIDYEEGEDPAEQVDVQALESEDQPAELDREIDIPEGIEADNILRIYFQEAAQVPLLKTDEEVALARQIEDCRKAQEELKRGEADSKRREQLQRTIERGRAARDHLIKANMRLVLSVARRYYGYGLPLLDLIQEGNIGLMRSIRNYDYRRGFKFSTYATWWIRQAVTRALAEQSRTIRLPVYMNDQVNRMVRERRRLLQELDREPTVDELAQALQVSPETVDEMERISRQPLSLQTPVGENDEQELGDVIGDVNAPGPEEAAFQTLADEDMRQKLAELPPRELRVLQMRYGLTGEAPLTLQEVGRQMGITRERARQLEAQALRRLRSQGGPAASEMGEPAGE